MKKSKTLFVFFLVVALLCAPTSMVQASSLEITLSEDISLQETSYAVQEDTSLREQGVKHFRLPDNTYTAVVYDQPVHYLQGDTWVDIDNSLVSAALVGEPLTGTVKRNTELTLSDAERIAQGHQTLNRPYSVGYWQNDANDFTVQLPQRITDNSPIMVSYQGHTLRFSLNAITGVTAAVTQPASKDADTASLAAKLEQTADDTERMRLQVEHAAAVYTNRAAVAYPAVRTDTDLRYYINGQTLKEDIVFNALPSQSSFSFDFTYTGLTAELQENKQVIFYDSADQAVFIIAAPFMYDDGDGYSTAVAVTVEQTATGCRYTVTPDRAWLQAPERVYPVTLDPQVTTTQNVSYIQDSGVQQSNPAENYQTLNRIYVGADANGGQGRMYFNLSQWPSAANLNADTITSAYLKLNYYPQASWQTAYQTTFAVYKVNQAWNSGTITWNSQTGIGGTQISTVNIKDSRNKTSGYDDFNVTEWVRSHYANPSADYGIRIQEALPSSSLNRACYISSDYTANTALRPIVRINYVFGNGEADGLISGATYYLRNVNSGKYMEVPSTVAGTGLQQMYLKGDSKQRFKLVYNTTTLDYTLVLQDTPGLAVEIAGQSPNDGTPVQINNKPTSGVKQSQRFNIEKVGSSAYKIVSYAGNYQKTICILGSSTADGASVIQIGNGDYPHQQWYFESANKTIHTNTDVNACSEYDREQAAEYAETWGASVNWIPYGYFSTGDCTNFVSQCLAAGGLTQIKISGAQENNPAQWYFDTRITYAHSWTSATLMNQHFATPTNMRSYQSIEYASGNDAFNDMDFLLRYLEEGDIIQIKRESEETYEHSMIIYSVGVDCNGCHREGSSNEQACENEGNKEILYAQHSIDYINGHLYQFLKTEGRAVTFIKIKK